MGRCTVIRWAFAAGVLSCCGCSAPNSFGWMHASTTAQASAPNSNSSSTNQANPLKPGDANASASASGSATSSTDKSTASTSSADGDKTVAVGNNGYKTAAIDPALRKQMMDELQYEPADKRQAMFDQWSKFDSAFIRELIENHRMARELADSHKASGSDWGNSSPLKTASNDSGATKAPAGAQSQPNQVPALTDPTAPNDSVLHQQTANSNPASSVAPPAALAGVNPWGDSPPSTPSQPPGRPPATTGGTSGAPSAMSALPGLPSGGGSPAPATPTGKPDAWDADIAPHSQTSNNQVPSAAPAHAGQLATMPAAPPSVPTPSGAGPPAAPRSDAFSGLPSLEADVAAQSSAARSITGGAPSAKVGAPASSPAPPASAAPNPFSDDPPSTPANRPAVPAGVQPSASASPTTITPAVAAGPVAASGVALASATSPSPGQPGSLDSEQPVKLSTPVDVPDGQVIAAAGSLPAGMSPQQASGTSAAAPAQPGTPTPTANQPSGLASLPGRLLGAINPLPGTNGSRNVSLPANWHDELQKIVAVASTEAGQTSVGSSDAEKLAYIQKQVNLRMLYLLSGQQARSLEPIAGLDAADQEFWQEVFWGMSSYFDRNTIADPRDRATQTITQLRAAVHKLQEKSKLELRNVSFCNKIDNYGRYERFKRDEFTAGQAVLLYAEVENFKTEPTTDGPYRTMLKSTIEIFDAAGKVVQAMPFAANEDLCASPRRDYYNSYEFSIPQGIALGPHQLKLTVEDQLSQKLASYTVNFTVK
jgi:hypothetical protein